MSRRRGGKKRSPSQSSPAGARGGGAERAPAPASSTDPRQRLVDWVAPESGPPEAWVRLSWLVFATFVAMVLVLGARPGGALPVWIFIQGRLLIALAALAVLGVGIFRSLRRPPFLRRRRMLALVALVLVLGVANAPFPYPSSHERRPSTVEFRPPFEGTWTVLWGGDPRHNRLAELYPDRRFGLHLVLEREGSTHTGAGERAEEYFAYGQPVLAPAAGLVVHVHDGEADRGRPGRRRVREPLGNLVVLEVAPEQYLFLTNLREGSLRVEPGQRVEAGTPLAEVGWSGAGGPTPEPHLALHLQDTPEPRRGEGVPLRLHGYRVGGRYVEAGVPRGGWGAGGERVGERIEAPPR